MRVIYLAESRGGDVELWSWAGHVFLEAYATNMRYLPSLLWNTIRGWVKKTWVKFKLGLEKWVTFFELRSG